MAGEPFLTQCFLLRPQGGAHGRVPSKNRQERFFMSKANPKGAKNIIFNKDIYISLKNEAQGSAL